jgi:hypothetical protein
MLGMTLNVIAALLGLFVLRPMRKAHFAKTRAEHPEFATPASAAAATATPATRTA